MPPNTPERPLTAAQVAAVFVVHVNTVYEWADKGKLAHFRTPGGELRFWQADVDAFIAETSRERSAEGVA